jgi:ABC-type sugar transport system ATPase subunit
LGKPFLAVERISFGLNYGECFALLGVNGAGKSSTFKSLTGDTVPTSGNISISGFDIQRDFKEARKLIGYCPQKDAIFPLLTVEEHLWFYARIKGIPLSMLQIVVNPDFCAWECKTKSCDASSSTPDWISSSNNCSCGCLGEASHSGEKTTLKPDWDQTSCSFICRTKTDAECKAINPEFVWRAATCDCGCDTTWTDA